MAQDLVTSAQQGDKKAFDILISRYYAKLLNTAIIFVKDEDTAKDIVQDASIIVFTNIKSLKDNSKFASWANRIVKNLALLYLRKNKLLENKFVSIDERLKEQLSDSESEQEETISAQELDGMIKQLPEGYKTIFTYYALENKSHKEISQILNIAPHTSSSNYYRARKLLQSAVRNYWALQLITLICVFLSIPLLKNLPKNDAEKQVAQKTEIITQKKKLLSQIKKITSQINFTARNLNSDTIGISPLLRDINSQLQDINPLNIDSKKYLTQFNPLEYHSDNIISDLGKLQFSQKTSKWDFAFYYSQSAVFNNNMLAAGSLDNVISLQNIDGIPQSDGPSWQNIKTWQDLAEFLSLQPAVSSLPDEVKFLIDIANSNAANNSSEIQTATKHFNPVEFGLMFSKGVTQGFSLDLGVKYTEFKSLYSAGWQMASINSEQKLQFIGFSLQPDLRIYKNKRFELHSAAGITYYVPINSELHTVYSLNGDIVFAKNRALSSKEKLSLQLGFSVSYNLSDKMSFYFSQSAQYFIKDDKQISTFTTDNPFVPTSCFGIRIVL
ncbi:MAG: sigma-70 family RNA polymerase sigma factor [Bacteroidales bacterium]|nr:sigma-70 family RNA polymerase sigma factor [Bacteroidales bacterium]